MHEFNHFFYSRVLKRAFSHGLKNLRCCVERKEENTDKTKHNQGKWNKGNTKYREKCERTARIIAKISHQIWSTPTTIAWFFEYEIQRGSNVLFHFFRFESQKTIFFHSVFSLSKYLFFAAFLFVERFFCYLNSYTFTMDYKERFHAQFTLHIHFSVTVLSPLCSSILTFWEISTSWEEEMRKTQQNDDIQKIMSVRT